MDYINAIEQCIEFVEKNIKNELTPEIIANECGFSKAFKKEFGFRPTQYLKRMDKYWEKKSMLEVGGGFMNPTITRKSAFKVPGYGIKTNIINSNYTKDVASFWINYKGENLENKMYKKLNLPKHGEVGLCIPSKDDNGEATYMLGVIVDNFNDVTDDMITVEVPEATYAVYITNQLIQVLKLKIMNLQM